MRCPWAYALAVLTAARACVRACVCKLLRYPAFLISPLPRDYPLTAEAFAAGDEDQEEDDDTHREREPVLMTGETNRGKVVPVNPPELVVLADVSGHDIAGIWVAFFSRCQRCRC